jgi:hypothetical protein
VWNEYLRQQIDPDNKYIQSEPREFERIAARLCDVLSVAEIDRTRDCIQLTERDERGVVLLVTPEAVELRFPTVDWLGPHSPAVSSRLLERIVLKDIDDAELVSRVDEARQKRHNEFVPCHYCQRPTPPEHRHKIDGKTVCHGCAERHEGIVH